MGDRSGFAGPALSYLICATPRSGSTLLCSALEDTGIAGHPEEHFEVLLETGQPRQPRDYFQRSNDPEHLKLRIDEHNAAWRDFFEGCGVEPMEVVYEEFVEDYQGTILWLLDGIGISTPENFAVTEPRMRRQADELSEEWVRLYNERTAVKTVQKG